MFLDHVQQLVRKLQIVHIDSGNIDGYRDRITQSVLPVFDLTDRLFPHEMVESFDHAVLLEERDEYARADHTQFRMDPADQRLGARQNRRVRTHVEFRLVVHLELLFFDRGREILDELLRIELAVMQIVVVDTDGFAYGVLDGIRRHLRVVETTLDADLLVDRGVHAHTHPYAVLRGIFLCEGCGELLQDRFIVLQMRTVHQEGVRIAPADDTAGRIRDLLKTFGDLLEHFVAVCFAVTFIDHPEVIDVNDDGVHLRVLVELVQLLRVAEEVVSIVQPRESVSFC